MFFRFPVNKQCGLADTFISGTMCEFANEVKYLGVMINSSLKTTSDVKRQTRNFYCNFYVICFRATALACIVVSYGLTRLKVV